MDAGQGARRDIALSNAVDYEGVADLFADAAEWIPVSPIEPHRGREVDDKGRSGDAARPFGRKGPCA